MGKVRTWAAHRLGRRGGFLVLLGLFDIFYGLFLIHGGSIGHVFAINEGVWGWVWVSVGAFLFTGALQHPPLFYWSRDKQPAYGRYDRVQYTAAALLKTAWALEFITHVHAPWEWAQGLCWVILAAIVVLVSGWPDHG